MNQRSWKHRVALMTIRKNFLKQLLMFWKIQAYFKELMFDHRLARGCERSVQLRANKRGFFKIAPHILENHRLLLRSCFLNTVYSFLEILEETETSFVPISTKKADRKMNFCLLIHWIIHLNFKVVGSSWNNSFHPFIWWNDGNELKLQESSHRNNWS